MARTHEGWNKARDIRFFYEAHKGEKYRDFKKLIKVVEVEQAAYGDWTLYVDDHGNYYDDYFDIGD